MLTEAEKKAAKDADAKKVADEAARKAKKASDDLESDDDVEDDDDPEDGELAFSPKQKAYVEKLRKEAASTRVKAKEIQLQHTELSNRFSKFEGGLKNLFGKDGDDSLTPEQRIERLEQREQEQAQQTEAMALANAVRDAALENGVGKADFEYFEFLVSKKLQEIKEGEELSDADLMAIAKQAKSKSAARSTSVEGGEPDPDEDDGEISLDDFSEMGIGARSALYQKDKALYEKLAASERLAKKKKV